MIFKNLLLLNWLISASLSVFGQLNNDSLKKGTEEKTEWILSNIPGHITVGVRIAGSPEIIGCKFGNALLFNGSSDGIFLDDMPIAGLDQFTLEAIICPYSGGNKEQRFLHIGEIRGNRVLMETRSTKTHWYFDAFLKSEDQQKALIDTTLLHPLDLWYHVAFIISNGKQETYINGVKELESRIKIVPFQGGKTSIGVRQNEQSWFKGAIYKIRISPKILTTKEFMPFW